MSPELTLGTVQFGLDYGVTNLSGQIKGNEARKILCFAQSANIRSLDVHKLFSTKLLNRKVYLILLVLDHSKEHLVSNLIPQWPQKLQ